MIDQLRDFLLDNWNKILPHLKQPHELRFLIAKGSIGGYGGKVNLFLFVDNEPQPIVIAKTVRDAQSDQLLAIEYNSLRYIHSTLSKSLREKTPQVYFLGQVGIYKVLIEEAVTGKSIDAIVTSNLFSRRQIACRMLKIIFVWLIESKKELNIRENYYINEANHKEYFSNPIEKFLRVYNISGKEKNFINNMENSISDIVKHKYPLVFEHGDLSPINIIYSKDKFWVIDWTCSKTKSLPFCDLFFLLIWFVFCNYPNEVEGIVRLNNFDQMFLKNGKYSSIASELIRDYCNKFNIDLLFLKTFFAMFIINRANKEYDILTRQADRGYIPLVKPFDQEMNYKNGSLSKNGLYINIFHRFVENSKKFIF